MIRFLVLTLLLMVLGVVGLSLYVRYAPVDPADWNVAVATTDAASAGPCTDKISLVPQGARVTCLVPGTPAEVLTKLDAIALAGPRTLKLVATDSLVTWESRSQLMGFPDYITAELATAAGGTRLDILSRQRFGGGDMGVNAARLKAWLAQL